MNNKIILAIFTLINNAHSYSSIQTRVLDLDGWSDCSAKGNHLQLTKLNVNVQPEADDYLCEVVYEGVLNKNVTSGVIERHISISGKDVKSLTGTDNLCHLTPESNCPLSKGPVKGTIDFDLPSWVKWMLQYNSATAKISAYDQDKEELFCVTGEIKVDGAGFIFR
tara:strand:+ start:164 stop:661 length:498 start_codon:yes stop_codon:yes gene_type:complete